MEKVTADKTQVQSQIEKKYNMCIRQLNREKEELCSELEIQGKALLKELQLEVESLEWQTICIKLL